MRHVKFVAAYNKFGLIEGGEWNNITMHVNGRRVVLWQGLVGGLFYLSMVRLAPGASNTQSDNKFLERRNMNSLGL